MHYVIVGNGVAGITAAFTLRHRETAARITVISGESDYFFSRTALMYAFLDRMNLRDLEPYERKVYGVQRIARVRGWVQDLDASRKLVTLRDGREIGYDRLLLATGSAPQRFPWTGLETAREGVVHFVSLDDLKECERLTPSTRRAVVVGGGLIGVELVECLVHHGVAVDFLVREPWYWPMALAQEEGALIGEHLRRHGVHLRLGDELDIVESDAAGRVQGIVTQRGERVPCQLLGICVGVRPAIDWLQSVRTPPDTGRGIKVTSAFRTTLPDVWAAGDCAEFTLSSGMTLVEQIWYAAKRQGELAARSMLGDQIDYRPPVFYNSARFFEIDYTTVGNVMPLPSGAGSFYYRFPGREVTIRIIEKDGAVIGFNMLGSRWNHTYFEQWILERRSLDYVVPSLHLAQFDVEFGRLPLEPALQAYASWRAAQPTATGGAHG